MRRLIRHILPFLLLLLLPMAAGATVVVLKSGQQVRGDILFQNEQVIVVKTANGSRFQYLQSDVQQVLDDEEAAPAAEEKKEAAKAKKVAVGLQLGGGMSALTGSAVDGRQNMLGGNVEANLEIGTADLLQRRIFLGGATGYHLRSIGGHTCSFIPLQVRMEAPLMQGKHAPLLGIGAGYGISASKGIKGGFYADINFGWRCQLNDKHAMLLALYSNMQQVRFNTLDEAIGNSSFAKENASGAIFSLGIKFGIYL